MKNDELESEEEILRRLTMVEKKILDHNKKFEVLENEIKKKRNIKIKGQIKVLNFI